MALRASSKALSRGTTDSSHPYPAAHGRISATIKRIVVLSSTVAISTTKNSGKVYTEEDWNDVAVDAVKEHGRAATGAEKYSASKTLAEKGE